ncbi:hypothetical protein DFH09DRAFT_1083531 [Mycena vulgaris]|nr:hypothetical protein DFH09DRAFT_1083531 [Mycena vulgaris]
MTILHRTGSAPARRGDLGLRAWHHTRAPLSRARAPPPAPSRASSTRRARACASSICPTRHLADLERREREWERQCALLAHDWIWAYEMATPRRLGGGLSREVYIPTMGREEVGIGLWTNRMGTLTYGRRRHQMVPAVNSRVGSGNFFAGTGIRKSERVIGRGRVHEQPGQLLSCLEFDRENHRRHKC